MGRAVQERDDLFAPCLDSGYAGDSTGQQLSVASGCFL